MDVRAVRVTECTVSVLDEIDVLISQNPKMSQFTHFHRVRCMESTLLRYIHTILFSLRENDDASDKNIWNNYIKYYKHNKES